MKKIFTLAMMMTIAITANAMNYSEAHREALFLSDKMAHELRLSDVQYDAVYDINLDYLLHVNAAADAFGPWWNSRNAALRHVLTPRQYDKYIGMTYFHRPLTWRDGTWNFAVYARYSDRNHFFKPRPRSVAHHNGGPTWRHNGHAAPPPAPRGGGHRHGR